MKARRPAPGYGPWSPACSPTRSIRRSATCSAPPSRSLPARSRAPPAVPPAREGEEPRYQGLWRQLAGRLPRLVAAAERERQETETLLADLASLGDAERRARIEEPRFHRLVVVERLLETAQAALPAEPAAAEARATLAAALAGKLADADEAMEGRARAACWIAQARRIACDETGAEQALSEATLYAVHGEEQALLCRALGLLRWEQGRLDEAAALLERAAELSAGAELPHEEGACRVLRALLMLEEGKVRDAVGPLRDGLPLLIDPGLTAYGGLALALGLAERGQARRARTQRDESAPLVPLAPAAARLLALRLQGLTALALGEPAEADEILAALRREALAAGRLPEAAVATLALARLDVERRAERDTGRRRIAELAATFRGAEGLDGILAALRDYPAQMPAGESLPDFTSSLMATFLRILRLRGVRSAPLPFT